MMGTKLTLKDNGHNYEITTTHCFMDILKTVVN